MGAESREFDRLVLHGERVVGIDLEAAEFTDARIEDSDLAGVVLTTPTVRRAVLRRTRLRDCVLGGAMVQDVDVTECPTERLVLRFATLQRVTFSGCGLAGADFYGTTFDRVVFDNCNLSGAHFDSVVVKELTLRSCRMLGLTGALSLKGAVVDFDDLTELAPSLAREAGLRIAAD